LDIDRSVGRCDRLGTFRCIARERGGAFNGSVAAAQGVLHRIALDIVGLDCATSLRPLLGKRPGCLGVAIISLAWSGIMHCFMVLDSPLPINVNSHWPAAIRSAARTENAPAKRSEQMDVKRSVCLIIVVTFMV
jgi:hypothetical protein